jgi:nucleoid DNA-binding protein
MPHADASRIVVEALRDLLSRDEAVRLPGLGTLAVQHVSSEIVVDPEGATHIRPPRNVVVLVPE